MSTLRAKRDPSFNWHSAAQERGRRRLLLIVSLLAAMLVGYHGRAWIGSEPTAPQNQSDASQARRFDPAQIVQQPQSIGVVEVGEPRATDKARTHNSNVVAKTALQQPEVQKDSPIEQLPKMARGSAASSGSSATVGSGASGSGSRALDNDVAAVTGTSERPRVLNAGSIPEAAASSANDGQTAQKARSIDSDRKRTAAARSPRAVDRDDDQNKALPQSNDYRSLREWTLRRQ